MGHCATPRRTKAVCAQGNHEQANSRAASRYAELADDSDAEEEVEETKEIKQPKQDVIEISSSDEQHGQSKPKTSQEEKDKLHLVKSKPQKMPTTPQLVTLKQHERTILRKELEQIHQGRGPLLPMTAVTIKEDQGFSNIGRALGIREVNTPSTGNCMAMALAQAAADHDLAAHDAILETVTSSIKRGIRWTGKLNMSEQFNHFARTNTLINVKRGWEDMPPRESKKQFQWYLDEYAATPSTREAIVEKYNWGSSELLAIAANFLQRKIFVLAYDTDGKNQWHCSLFRPSTTMQGKKIYETGQQVPLHLDECVTAIKLEKTQVSRPPLVLRFWGEHYSAFVHSLPPEVRRAAAQEQEAKSEDNFEKFTQAKQRGDAEIRPESEEEASQEPWDSSEWNGDTAELRQRLLGMTIPHDLKREIYLILEQANPTRHAELLAFLVNTAAQISHSEREQLLQVDVTDDNNAEVRRMLQKYHIPLVVLQQWQDTVVQDAKDSQQLQQELRPSEQGDSDSAYEPSSESSQENSQLALVTTSRSKRSQPISQKRAHSTTPVEGEQIRQIVRKKLEHQTEVDGTTAMVEANQPELQKEQQVTRDAWPELWQKLATYWPTSAQAPYPLERSSTEQWIATAKREPTKLIRMVQRFPFPEELMVTLSTKVLEAWTATWRRECMYARLVLYRSRTGDKATQRWLDDWKDKFHRPAARNLAPLVDNRDDWNRLRDCGYGKDDILRLCDEGNKLRFAQHILCAIIYEKDIRVLTGTEDEAENGALTRLTRHREVLRTNDRYHKAYYATKQNINWFEVARFFSAVFEHGEVGQTHQY
ncbi:hypothetical protein PR002_g9366 [Phytophthora rubi]|uniref:OTU domain-containing protein n=1 Tax=Phytophthora rubi TaxID=129364 RepID=A0A6A3MKN6_9STRA|nr:hypothetical protein PR002_g9366 [Phytophthora rubi]